MSRRDWYIERDSYGIRKALMRSRGDVESAASELRIKRQSLIDKLEEYGLDIGLYERIGRTPRADKTQPDFSRFHGLPVDSYRGLGWTLDCRKTMFYMKNDGIRIIVDKFSAPGLIMVITETSEDLYEVPLPNLSRELDRVVKERSLKK